MARRLLGNLFILWLALSLGLQATGTAWAVDLSSLGLSSATGGGDAAPSYPGAIMIPVNLWGSVGRPGIHQVPIHTDLVTLLSMAGGPGPDAQLGEVTIKRRSRGEEQVIQVSVADIVNKPGVHSPTLEANDIVIVPHERQLISNNAMTIVGFVTGVLGIVLAGYAISQTVHH